MQFNYKKIFTPFLVSFFLIMPLIVLAVKAPGAGAEFKNPIGFDTLREFLEAILNVILAIAFPLIVLAIIYTGFLFVSARGNKDKLGDAKRALVWTVIGAMIILGAFVLSRAISETVKDIENAGAAIPVLAEHSIEQENAV